MSHLVTDNNSDYFKDSGELASQGPSRIMASPTLNMENLKEH